MKRISGLATVAFVLAVVGSVSVEQILPRGGIPAIFNPQFVPAEQAGISDNAWVLGVEINGQAHAYSLNLLNRHEIVNDRIGETAFAAVW